MVTLYSSSIIDEVVNWLGLLVACIASWATVKTMVIAKNDIKPDIRRFKNNVGATLERAKKELIYKNILRMEPFLRRSLSKLLKILMLT